MTPLSATARSNIAWTPTTLTQDNLNRRVAEVFQSIVADANRRIADYPKNINALGSGYWYASDYYNALKVTGNTTRLNALRNTHAFYHGRPPVGFNHVDNSNPLPLQITPKETCLYELKPSHTPSQGLDSIHSSLCFIDCQIAVEMAFYRVLQEVAPHKFDALFNTSRDEEFRMKFSPSILDTPLVNLLGSGKHSNTSRVKVGEALFFRNVPSYRIRHLDGDASGYHVVCIQDQGEKKYTALGVPEQGLSEEEFDLKLLEEFNLPPTFSENSLLPEVKQRMLHFIGDDARKNRSLFLNTTITFEKFKLAKERGANNLDTRMGFMGETYFLDASKVALLLS